MPGFWNLDLAFRPLFLELGFGIWKLSDQLKKKPGFGPFKTGKDRKRGMQGKGVSRMENREGAVEGRRKRSMGRSKRSAGVLEAEN